MRCAGEPNRWNNIGGKGTVDFPTCESRCLKLSGCEFLTFSADACTSWPTCSEMVPADGTTVYFKEASSATSSEATTTEAAATEAVTTAAATEAATTEAATTEAASTEAATTEAATTEAGASSSASAASATPAAAGSASEMQLMWEEARCSGPAPFGLNNLGDALTLEECIESCLAEKSCAFLTFKSGGCTSWSECDSSRDTRDCVTYRKEVAAAPASTIAATSSSAAAPSSTAAAASSTIAPAPSTTTAPSSTAAAASSTTMPA
eukprot:CAMPEP_0170608608 /NCGR_PEP_ID=MMETSP0224-20130122/21677_1 /TAXON_ID=285029 /ORGANISM="Togula jolla, Strain CCCM 725" /LENGTH=264 /DNA_ID=CAMNT_0010933849 /DNA_START=215 /DNA_END=1005 /DNA_ORIENTATION=-